ncbi:hypothetical protein AB1E33_13960 [Ruegeria sp. 2012CJ15-1]
MLHFLAFSWWRGFSGVTRVAVFAASRKPDFGRIFFIAAVCAVLVLMAYMIEFRTVINGAQSVPKIVQEINLAHENNVAAWFSCALLAIVGLHMMDGHTLFGSVLPHVARAWVMIASVMFLLSADEVGSLHERLSGVGRSMGVGSWGLLLPLGAVLAAVLLWAMATICWAGGAQRKQALTLLMGFALPGSVAVQEVLEHSMTWSGARASAARIAIEEGSELPGMLVLLSVAIGNSSGILADRHGRYGALFEVLAECRGALQIGIILLAPVISHLTADLQDHGRGRPADWLAAMAFLSAAAVVAVGWLLGRNGHSILVVVGLLLTLSCACVAISPDGAFETAAMTVNGRAVLLVALTAVLQAVSYWMAYRTASPLWLVVLITGVCLALLGLSERRSVAFLLTIVLGALINLEMSLAQKTEPDFEG